MDFSTSELGSEILHSKWMEMATSCQRTEDLQDWEIPI